MIQHIPPTGSAPEPKSDPATLYCANHPQRETLLRCNRCEKPICSECAVLTPTGYRCKQCVRGQQKVFETSKALDYPIAIVVSGVIAFLASYIGGILVYFSLIVAPIAGLIIAEAVRALVKRRRSKALFLCAAGGALLGSLPRIVIYLLPFFLYGDGGSIISLVIQVVYTAILVSSVYYRLSGIQL